MVSGACLDTSLDATDTYIYNTINYEDEPSDYDDPFDIIAVISESDVDWKVIVEYEGGCEEHSFYTWWDSDWQSSGQTRFFLSHYNNEDECDAVVRDTLELELDRILDDDLADSTIVRIVNSSNGRNISVDPYLADISQSNGCGMTGLVKSNSCGYGIWEDRWILLPDSVKGEAVWIIPVRASSSVSLDTPGYGDCGVGFTLLFGFESSELSNSCYETDAGYAIPAYINCFVEK